MAAFDNGINIGDPINVVIAMPMPTQEQTLLADGEIKVGMIVKYSGTAGKVSPCGAADPDAVGWVAAGWIEQTLGDQKQGFWTAKPADAIATGQRVKVYHFASGQAFWALLPTGVTATKGKRLTLAASGRVTNMTAADAATVDGTYGADESGVIANLRTRLAEALVAPLRVLVTKVAAADDAPVPVEVL